LGLLKIRSPEGPITEIPIKWTVQLKDGAWQDRYETQAVGTRAGEVLIVRHHGLEPSEYFFGRFGPGSKNATLDLIDGRALYQPLAASDFLLFDLGLEFLHWPSQTVVKKEMRKSRSCRVVESTNPNPQAGTYSRVLSWIDFETGNLIMAEAYDKRNVLLKEFSIRKISRNEGRAQLREIEMRNDQTGSRTRLEFNLDIDEQ
jgi:hypothetical protein